MDQADTAKEIQNVRQRLHDLANVVHVHGAKIEIGKMDLANVKEDVSGMKADQKKVIITIVLAVLGAVLALVLK